MTQLAEFSRESAKRYLQNIVFVDDEIYTKSTDQPVVSTAELPAFQSPFSAQKGADDAVKKDGSAQPTPVASAVSSTPSVNGNPVATLPDGATQPVPVVASLPIVEEKTPYHPRQLVESFAREGMICALYEPKEGFAADKDSELYKLCERADVVVLDWDLFGMDGKNILPLIANLVDESQNTVPHHSRLCVVYTTKPDLSRVGGAIYEHLSNAGLKVKQVVKPVTLIAGSTRILVFGKPDAPGRSAEMKALEVAEDQLAAKIIDAFAAMHEGILPSYALRGMAAVRRNSKKILDKFPKDLDSVFLVHRALVIKHEDAFDQLPELLAEEVLAVIHDDQIAQAQAVALANDFANTLSLQGVTMNSIEGRAKQEPGVLARRFVGGGAPAVAEDWNLKSADKVSKLVKSIHGALGCDVNHAEKQLAALFNLRSQYFKSKAPTLGFGTIVRFDVEVIAEDGQPAKNVHRYALCLMPLCDSMRIAQAVPTSFPFWALQPVGNNKSGRGVVIHTEDSGYVELLVSGKPRDQLSIESFSADASGTVVAEAEGGGYWFKGPKNIKWIAQLKPSHAQRVAHDIGQLFSRVGVVEAEWLRMATDS